MGTTTSDPVLFAPIVDPAQLATLGLTRRECEVMQWLVEGKRDREIAIILGLSTRTVEKHVAHILEKLAVETRTAAANQCRYIAVTGVSNTRKQSFSSRRSRS